MPRTMDLTMARTMHSQTMSEFPDIMAGTRLVMKGLIRATALGRTEECPVPDSAHHRHHNERWSFIYIVLSSRVEKRRDGWFLLGRPF